MPRRLRIVFDYDGEEPRLPWGWRLVVVAAIVTLVIVARVM